MKIKLSTQEINGAAKEFRLAGKEMSEIIHGLEKVVDNLVNGWPDLEEQDMHEYYRLWQEQTLGLVQVLNTISSELTAVEKHMQKVER